VKNSTKEQLACTAIGVPSAGVWLYLSAKQVGLVEALVFLVVLCLPFLQAFNDSTLQDGAWLYDKRDAKDPAEQDAPRDDPK
jgi:hypothetical protein